MSLKALRTKIEAAEPSGYESKDAETIEALKGDALVLADAVDHLRTALESLIVVYEGANHPGGPIGYATLREAHHALAFNA